jgi:hypothetical protein
MLKTLVGFIFKELNRFIFKNLLKSSEMNKNEDY